MNHTVSTLFDNLGRSHNEPDRQLIRHRDLKYALEWGYMHAVPRPCFTPQLLEELRIWFGELAQPQQEIRYAVMASDVPGTFNLGGDLKLFKHLIEQKDRDALFAYAKACVDRVYEKFNGFGQDITHITLVQGDALGGGFECAISSDVLIAERGARMGMPEVLFNLFPGMGAYSILSRKLDQAQAKRMILSGDLYTAEELYKMGVVDVLAETGEGEMAVYNYVRREEKARNGYLALRHAQRLVDKVPYQELMDITEIWVDAALRLQTKDLRMMERLVSRQGKRVTAG